MFVFGFQIINSFIIMRERRLIYFPVVGVLGVLMCLMTFFFDYKIRLPTKEELDKTSLEES